MHITPFDASLEVLTYGRVGRALTLIKDDLMLQQNHWADISFELWHRKEPFATGFLVEFWAWGA